MKIRHKKLIASGIALSLAGVLGAGALLQTSVSVQASYAMMPGIEQIVKDTSEEKPFKILEIVDDTSEAEIGYYVSGQEPYVKLYEYKYTDSDGQEQTMKFQSLEEGLSKLPKPELRKEFAMNVKLDKNGNIVADSNTGIKQIQNVCYPDGSSAGESEDYPLSYSTYQEKYFLTQEEKNSNAWKEIKQFINPTTNEPTTYTKKIKGNYQENPAGTGDYTKKEQQYYPIREVENGTDTGDAGNPNAKYRENIQNFYYADSDGANAPYFLEFSEVENTTVNTALNDPSGQGKETILSEYNYENGRYGYYENVYSDLTTEIANNISNKNYTFPGESPASPDGKKLLIQDNTSAANAFSAGNDEFTSLDEGNETEQSNAEYNTNGQNQPDAAESEPQIDSGVADAGFSDGEFSSEELNAGESHLDSTDSNNQNSNETSNPEEEAVIDNEATKQTDNNSANSIKTPLITYAPSSGENTGSDTTIDKTNTSEDPLVYYGITIDQYPFYQYKLISDLNTIKDKAINVDENQGPSFNLEQQLSANPISINNGIQYCNITIQDGQYWFWLWNQDENVNNAVKYPISIVTQRQPVAYSDIRKLPEDLGYNYYYKVDKVYFCCKKDEAAAAEDPHAYKYYGWYSPSYADENNPYIPVKDGETPTHYISDAEYELTPGTGNYDFIPDDNATEQNVEVDHMYYQGGYTNHDWFKQYVFHLEPGKEGSEERKQFDAFKIEVTTITTKEFNEQYGGAEKTASATFGDSEVTETTDDGDSTDFDNPSADISVTSDDAQADNSQTDNTSDSQNTGTQDTNEAPTEDQATAQNEGDTSEVEPMVSEAGVELVSIEKGLAETTDEFQDGTSADSQTTEDSAQITNNISDEADADAQFTDNSPDAIDDDGAFSAGDTVASNTSGKLAEYGLIYVNSSDINQAAAEEMRNIPTIINAAKLTDNSTAGNSTTGNSTTAQSFTAYIKGTDQDADGHYVNTLVYVFKNTLAETNESTYQSDLINVNFHTNFNLNADGDSGSTASNEAIQGFEEILEYIESENKYRKLGQTTDSSGISDGSDEVSDEETVTPTPANAKIPLLKKDISQARAIEYIINYNLKRALNTKKSIRVLEIEPAKISDNKNRLTSNKVSEWLGISVPEIESSVVCCEGSKDSEKKKNMFDGKDDDNIWHSAYNSYNAHDQNINNGHHYIKLTLKNPASLSGFNYKPRTKSRNGKIVTFEVVLTFGNNETHTEEGKFDYSNIDIDTTLKKFRFADDKVYQDVKEIQINIITAANAENNSYDTKFASCSELSLVSETEVTVDTMTAAEFAGHIDDIGSKYDMIYIGDQKNNDSNTDLLTGSGEMCYTHVGAVRGITESEGQDQKNFIKLLGQLDKDYANNDPNSNNFTSINNFSESGSGYFRGSGNDMTPQICSELKEFVQSGYPVVISSALMNGGNSRSINQSKVDASSYYYEFLDYALKYDNVFTSSELKNNIDKLDFFSNLAKPVIKFTKMPPEPPRANDSVDASGRGMVNSGQLEYQFSIENDSDAAPAVTTYDCNLYLDLNFDGNLSEKENQSEYIQIADSSGQVLSQMQGSDGKKHYQLRAGQEYTLTRKLPESYYKIITWKLEVSSNRNSYIHTSETGYAKQGRKAGVARQCIKVLQITPFKNRNYWDLSDSNGKFQNKLNTLKTTYNFDFDIQIETISVKDVNGYKNKDELKNILDNGKNNDGGYDMLIIGFTDGYENIDNSQNQVQNILDFIKAGKSVIFSHDNTSFINVDQDKNTMNYTIPDSSLEYTAEGGIYKNWGYYMNKLLRSAVGMDRYGITSTELINSSDQTVSQLLKKGNELTDGNQVSFKELMKYAGDIAYKKGTRLQSYAQTQAYSNEYLSYKKSDEWATAACKINDGAITQYPYIIGDSISIGTTHSQYYQLGLEQDRDINGNADGKSDVVVWYTLAGGKYDNSPGDVRNYYYFYSKGNVIYTGAGHSEVGDCEEEVNLFINAITAAANVTAVEPKASFVKGMNPNAGVETTKYYMTDQTTWNEEQNVVNNDIDLYLNIKEYNMVSADLSQSDLDKQEMTIKFYIENENGTEQTDGPESVKLKDITDEINTIWEYGGSKDGIKVSNDQMFHTKNSSVYSLKLSGIEKYLKKTEGNGTKTYKNSCKVYAKVSSTVYLYGKANTRTVWASINLKQRQLFDLD